MATRASPAATLDALVRKVDADSKSGEVLWRVRSDDGAVDFTYGDPARRFFIASATKLFVTAILAQLRAEGRVDWDAPIAPYLADLDLAGILVVKGADRSGSMTVREVMAHTSGLADYFEGRRPDGPTTIERAIVADVGWTVADVVAWTKAMRPGTPGRGLYSDTGYQLLGALIERVDGRSFAAAVAARITGPLGMDATSVFGPADVPRYDEIAAMRWGDGPLRIPLAMASVQADGGVVSTLDDGLAFLDAFFGGRLFAVGLLAEMATDWHRIFFPLQYGTGIMRFSMPRVLTGLRAVPPFVGHSGASGTVMFRAADAGLTIAGTVNQAKHRSMPYQLMVRTALAARG
jgi:CubicO group peptidase (beta-lactamase class C family)